MSNALHVPCDAVTARTAQGTRSPVYPRLVLATTILASSLAFIDGSVVNVGLPAIGRSFHAGAIGLQWVVNAYLLPLSALLLLGGAAGDRYGRRRLLITGVLLFGIASLACAVAPTLFLLLLVRFLRGASAAMLMPNSLAILGQSFSGEAKGRAIGIWAATGAAAGAIGPVLGGWLIDAGSWRLAFLINVPLSTAAIVLASRYVDRNVDDTAGSLGWLFVLVPYVLIQAGGYTATQAGAALLPLPLVIAVASPAAGALAAKVGPRWLLITGPVIVAAGFLLAVRIGSDTSYWLGVFPAMIVIALGMAGAVAPLTTAVLMSVDSHHTGAASGLNSAVARTGGLVATALIGPVIVSSGPALLSAFGVAAAMGAVICSVAAASAFTLIAPAGKPSHR